MALSLSFQTQQRCDLDLALLIFVDHVQLGAALLAAGRAIFHDLSSFLLCKMRGLHKSSGFQTISPKAEGSVEAPWGAEWAGLLGL